MGYMGVGDLCGCVSVVCVEGVCEQCGSGQCEYVGVSDVVCTSSLQLANCR